jgi:hypothetical protein
MISSPILLVTFNRPDTTQKVFDVIKKAKPPRLYVSNDGPRMGNDQDIKARNEIKDIVNQVDWECEVFTNFYKDNLGCGRAISGAIKWVFENEDRLIILEDDCVPAMSFFNYCNHCLEKYKDDERIMHIAGNNYTEKHNYTNEDYLFSKYEHCSGWATWKRAWLQFDYEMKDWPFFRDNKLFEFCNSKKETFYYEKLINMYYNDKNQPWALRWEFAIFKMNGLSIVPRINLVKHIGDFGTHSTNELKYKVDLDLDFIVINEPLDVIRNEKYDKYHFENYINKKRPLLIRVYSRLKKIMNKLLK